MKLRGGSDTAGFSLVEVLVAVLLLATALAALAQLFVMALVASDSARRTSMASVLAEQKIEHVRSAPFVAAGAGVEYLSERGELVALVGESPAGASYVRRWRIEPVLNRLGTATIHVTVQRVGDPDAANVAGRRPAMARMFAIRVRHGP